MKYYIIAGEASGDLHGSNLIKAIHKEDPNANVRAWGGNLMATSGAEIVKHYKDLAFMGFVEVIQNLPTIARNFKFCKKDILQFQPDVLILIDYPGFNLRMAEWAKKQEIRVFYYISPQLWAWKSDRVKIIADCVERMYVIIPFEKEFYQQYKVDVDYAGHPLIDVVNNHTPSIDFLEKNKLTKQKPIIALLPGSRKQEIMRMLNGMLSVQPSFPDYQFVIAGAPSIDASVYQPFLQQNPGVFLVENQTYDLLHYANSALVASGTATLETALFNVPQVVCYKSNWLSYQLARRLVSKKLKFIALANLIADKKIVTELMQDDFKFKNIKRELEYCLSANGRDTIIKGYHNVHDKLNLGGASEKIGKLMVERLKSF